MLTPLPLFLLLGWSLCLIQHGQAGADAGVPRGDTGSALSLVLLEKIADFASKLNVPTNSLRSTDTPFGKTICPPHHIADCLPRLFRSRLLYAIQSGLFGALA
jgi:hypothetical protein